MNYGMGFNSPVIQEYYKNQLENMFGNLYGNTVRSRAESAMNAALANQYASAKNANTYGPRISAAATNTNASKTYNDILNEYTPIRRTSTPKSSATSTA